ncbi:MAG TPA: class I SAM-dependent methyltransferase [Actinomycetota bacterium]|jgi:ubiquinone/menaquinone biosynthesis C-methylase UbiE|nr:class I SAM-dependent methyltransferase [Actinomycetota bacterium]
MGGEGSVSFERAADVYDRTRLTDPVALAAALDVLDGVLPAGTALEIGVGTGAIAVPLAQRGRRVIGLDVSAAMLGRLRAKAGSEGVAVAVADATRLPVADDVFDGAYCRWVLHLIASWRDAVRELCRAVAPGGVIVVEPAGYTGEWRTVWRRFVQELGPAAEPVGVDARNGYADLDDAFAACGAAAREVIATPMRIDSSLERFLDEAAARAYSWTWRAGDAELARVVDAVRAWAIDRYGPDLTQPFSPDAAQSWRVYDVRT